MKKDTLLALQRSIKHWERLLLGEDHVMGPGTCTLCHKFNVGNSPCVGCPVFKATGEWTCNGTPYYGAVRLFAGKVDVHNVLAIWKELDFLRSLLPSAKLKK